MYEFWMWFSQMQNYADIRAYVIYIRECFTRIFITHLWAGFSSRLVSCGNFVQRPEKLRQHSFTLVQSIIDKGKMSTHPLALPCLFYLGPRTDWWFQFYIVNLTIKFCLCDIMRYEVCEHCRKIHNPLTRVIHFFCNSRILFTTKNSS